MRPDLRSTSTTTPRPRRGMTSTASISQPGGDTVWRTVEQATNAALSLVVTPTDPSVSPHVTQGLWTTPSTPVAGNTVNMDIPNERVNHDGNGPPPIPESDLHTAHVVGSWEIESIPEPTLDVEYALYLRRRSGWVREHENEHVLIKRENVVGFFPNRMAALEEGLLRFGDVPFFITELALDDPVDPSSHSAVSLNERSLADVWLSPEEDEAWRDL